MFPAASVPVASYGLPTGSVLNTHAYFIHCVTPGVGSPVWALRSGSRLSVVMSCRDFKIASTMFSALEAHWFN